MKVLEQDESTRSDDNYQVLWNDKETGMRIYSSEPALLPKNICIRGFNKTADLKCVCRQLFAENEAKEYVEKIKRTVANYNASLQQEECEDFGIHIAE